MGCRLDRIVRSIRSRLLMASTGSGCLEKKLQDKNAQRHNAKGNPGETKAEKVSLGRRWARTLWWGHSVLSGGMCQKIRL